MKRALVVLAFFTVSSAAHGQQPLVHEGVIGAPVDSVWNVFATASGIESWMAPHAVLDLRVGGAMQTVYTQAAKVGDPSTIENTILAFEPKRMLALQVSKAPAGFPFPNAIKNMWTVIYFDSIDANTTRVREVSMGFTADDESQKMRSFFERGNALTMGTLQRRFASTGTVHEPAR